MMLLFMGGFFGCVEVSGFPRIDLLCDGLK